VLIEDDSVRSASSTLFNAEVGYRIGKSWSVTLEALNLFDAEVNDIEYFYPSLLAGEPPGPNSGGYDDVHFHPAEPFQLRLGLRASF
jgi:outer membrane receptor protein involved in Fe transport